jgi:hypothetical protein
MANEQSLQTFNVNREWYFQHPKLMWEGLLSGSSATLYTVPAKGLQGPPPKAMVTEVLIANTDSVERSVTLYFIPTGGSPGAANTILPAVPFPPNSFTRLDFQTIIEEAGTIRGLASSANVVNVTISGIEFLLSRA